MSVTGAPRREISFGAAALGLLLAVCTAAAAEPCPTGRLLYVPVDTVTEPLGLRGETRAQYLDRRYGAGRWKLLKEDDATVVIALPPACGDARFCVRITEPPGAALERADVIVEARIAYLGADGRVTTIYGHREVAGYLLTPGADAEISVPPDLFKEAGALLVAVTWVGSGEEGRPPVHVVAAPVQEAAGSCACCVYVKDRFTAIRLNREQNQPPAP